MCFDLDSHPPILPIAGGALDAAGVVLDAPDGNRLSAFQARAAEPGGAGVVILPDVRGLHPYYEELALRFAEHGIDAVAIDYFGRTTALGSGRDEMFEFWPHVERLRWAGVSADIGAGVGALRSIAGGRVRSAFTVGFCMGGLMAFDSATLGLDLAGVVGFYGRTTAQHPSGAPIAVDAASSMRGSVLGLFGGADEGIPAEAVAAFGAALTAAGIDHRLVTYAGAPHSFFDRKAAEFAEASAAAWSETIDFIRARTAAGPA